MLRHAVILVDDEPGVLSALGRVFRDESYDVLVTSEPQQALEWLHTREVDVLVADDRMPAMSGTTLFQLAKANSPSTARIMLTGHPGESIILQAREHGLFQLFAKPWDDQELRRVIRTHMRDRELTGARREDTLRD